MKSLIFLLVLQLKGQGGHRCAPVMAGCCGTQTILMEVLLPLLHFPKLPLAARIGQMRRGVILPRPPRGGG